jgi:hypothetical protein
MLIAFPVKVTLKGYAPFVPLAEKLADGSPRVTAEAILMANNIIIMVVANINRVFVFIMVYTNSFLFCDSLGFSAGIIAAFNLLIVA